MNRIKYWNLFRIISGVACFHAMIVINYTTLSFPTISSLYSREDEQNYAQVPREITREEMETVMFSWTALRHPRHRSPPFELYDCFSYSG